MKHEKTCTVADARIYFFFVSLERRKDSKVHFKEQSPLLSPSQTEAQQSQPRAADGTVGCASLEISESSSARKGRTRGWLFQSFSWIFPSAHVYLHSKNKYWEDTNLPMACRVDVGWEPQKILGPLSCSKNINYPLLLAKVEDVLSSSSFELCCPVWTKSQNPVMAKRTSCSWWFWARCRWVGSSQGISSFLLYQMRHKWNLGFAEGRSTLLCSSLCHGKQRGGRPWDWFLP